MQGYGLTVHCTADIQTTVAHVHPDARLCDKRLLAGINGIDRSAFFIRLFQPSLPYKLKTASFEQ
jgi:hypothetical protein